MKTMGVMLFLLCLSLPPRESWGHSLNYHIEQKGIAVRAFYTEQDPASYSEYEIYGPGDRDTIPHQTGRTDRNGFLAFVPDKPGIWKIRLWGESSHGYHGFTAEVKVDKEFNLESFSKPLVATHTKLITGLSLIFGVFGIYAYLKSRRGQGEKGQSTMGKGEN